MTLFNGLNIYLDSSTLGKDTNELKRLLEKEKANVLASPSKKTTHVVTNNHNYTQTDAVNAKLVSVRPEKLIVNSMQPKWIKDSIKANERAKENLYHPKIKRILQGVVLTTSQVPASTELTKVIIVVETLGGTYTPDFTDRVTHLLAYSEPCEGEKFDKAKQRGVKIVSFEWLNQCVKHQKRVEESLFDLKQETLRNLFNQLVFTIDKSHFKTPDNEVTKQLQTMIQTFGGKVSDVFDQSITHVLCRYSQGPYYEDGKKFKKTIVTPHWVDDCIRHKTLAVEKVDLFGVSKLLHEPIKEPKADILKDCKISVTGWNGSERNDLIYAITNLGAEYTGKFGRDNTHLLSKDATGDTKKASKAVEWKIPVLKAEWIQDCTASWSKKPISQYLWDKKQPLEEEKEEERPAKKQKVQERRFIVGSSLDHLKEQIETIPGGKCISTSNDYNMDCTHIILAQLKRTERFLCGCSAGRWIIKPEYITDSLKKNRYVDEELYEWKGDGEANCTTTSTKMLWNGAPNYWRVHREQTGGGAFKGKKIILYVSEKSQPPLDILKKVIQAGDGSTIVYDQHTPLSEKTMKEVDYALVDAANTKKNDKLIKMLRKYEVKIYKSNVLLDLFTHKPPVKFDNYKFVESE